MNKAFADVERAIIEFGDSKQDVIVRPFSETCRNKAMSCRSALLVAIEDYADFRVKQALKRRKKK